MSRRVRSRPYSQAHWQHRSWCSCVWGSCRRLCRCVIVTALAAGMTRGAPTNKLIASLEKHVGQLEGERNPFTASVRHRQAQAYLEDTLGSLGSGILRRHTFTWEGVHGLNLILELPGKEPGRPAIIGAHYDCVPGSPGADDNASGVAVLVELARELSEEGPRFPVWLVAFDLEEWGMRGSEALAAELRQNGPRPSWMASLEMVGYRSHERGSQRYPFPFRWFYPDTADFILLVGNVKAHRLLGGMASALGEAEIKTERFTMPFNGWLIPASRLSDQAPFWDMGVPGVMVTDTAWFRNANYHRPSDTVDTLDLEFMAGLVKGLALFLKRGR